MLKRLLKVLVLLIGAIVALIGIYFAAAFALARWTVNDDFVPASDGVVIALSSNGIHANLHFPIRALDVDWTKTFPPEEFPFPPLNPDTISFGWGSREFYLNVPTWDDLELRYAVTALTGIGGSALHVAYWDPWPPGEDYVEFRISDEAYRALVAHVLAAVRPDGAGRPHRIHGYSYLGNDGFYEAEGTYTAFMTCNEWVRQGLATAGIRTGLWSPFPDPLLDHLRTE
ncbi:MAG: TIGR02117 family protein [Alphaproteobacteria bacterium]